VRDPEMAWVTGVLFGRGKTAVLMEILANGRAVPFLRPEFLTELSARGSVRGIYLADTFTGGR
jgi:hypothetical protein